MPKNENLRIARAHYDAFNGRRFDEGAALNASDAVWTKLPTGERFVGPAGYKAFLSSWADAMPDARVEVTRMIADDDTVAVQFKGRGTHTGPLKTPMGDVPATGRSIDLDFCEVLRVSSGRIVGAELYFDVATMMRQLGLAS